MCALEKKHLQSTFNPQLEIDIMRIEYIEISLTKVLEYFEAGFVHKDKLPITQFGRLIVDVANNVVCFKAYIDDSPAKAIKSKK
jgi:hypothetical protein